jgi:hypothetical protein
MKRTIVLAILVAACCSAAGAEQQVRLRERFAKADGALFVASVPSGSVRLLPSSGDEVVVDGTIADGMSAPGIVSSSDGRVLQLVISTAGRRIGKDTETRLEIRVPSYCSLRVDGFSSSIDIQADGGQRSIDTSSVDGSITIRGAGASVTARTFSGGIDVQGRVLRLDARSTTGPISVGGRVGRLDVESMSGDVTLEIRDMGSAEVTTVSGAITAGCAFAYPETVNVFRVSSDRGPISLAVPPHLAASFELTLTPGLWIQEEKGTPPAAATTSWEGLYSRIRVSPEATETNGSVTLTGTGTMTVGGYYDGTGTHASRIDKLTRSFSTGSDSTQIYLSSRDGTLSLEFRDLP